jgi:hypothetical protein
MKLAVFFRCVLATMYDRPRRSIISHCLRKAERYDQEMTRIRRALLVKSVDPGIDLTFALVWD